MMYKTGWFILLIFLSSCLRPNYRPQPVLIPQHWRIDANDGSTLCNSEWWKQFDDEVLDDLIRIGIENNLDLMVAINRVKEYYALYRVAMAPLFPFIDGEASYTRFKLSSALPFDPSSGTGGTGGATGGITSLPTGFPTIFNAYYGALSLNWELDFWGRIYSTTEAAFADLMSQVEARRAVLLTVVTSIASTYINLRKLDSQLLIAKKTVKSRLQSLELAENRFHLGETSKLEVQQAEALVQTAKISQLELERSIPEQENMLSVLLGQDPQWIERGKTIENFAYPVDVPAGIPSELLLRRPDLRQSEDQLIATNARVAAARALYFPQILLTGLYGSQSTLLEQFLTTPATFWQYGVSAMQTVFDAGKTYYNVDAAMARRDQALFTYKQNILTAFKEVNDALNQTVMNQKLYLQHRTQVEVVSEYLHLSQLRYSEGEIDYLNVLDAERAVFDAELAFVQSQADNFLAVVKLYGALGGGWVFEEDTRRMEEPCKSLTEEEEE